MVLRSQSSAGRSEVVVRADIHSERPGVEPRPEPEIARPETEIAPVAGPLSDPTAVGTNFPPSTYEMRYRNYFRNHVGLSISGPTGTGNYPNTV